MSKCSPTTSYKLYIRKPVLLSVVVIGPKEQRVRELNEGVVTPKTLLPNVYL